MATRVLHTLTDIDAVTRVAVCAVCGPVKIKPRHNTQGVQSWRCKVSYSSSPKKRKRPKRENNRGSPRHRLRRKLTLEQCTDCGLCHNNPAFFDIHHIDGDNRNNQKENLAVVCPNCHRERHLRNGDWQRSSFRKGTRAEPQPPQ